MAERISATRFSKPETKFHVTSITCLHRSAAGHPEHSWNEANQTCESTKRYKRQEQGEPQFPVQNSMYTDIKKMSFIQQHQ